MAVNKVIYGKNTLIDLTNDTVVPSALKKGYIAHKSDGTVITGTYVPGGGGGDEIDAVLLNGFSYGDVEVSDDGKTVILTNKTTGQVLTKTFSDDECTIVLKDSEERELGKLVKSYSDDNSVITYVNDHSGTTTIKTFNFRNKTMEEVTKDTATGEVVSSLVKTIV